MDPKIVNNFFRLLQKDKANIAKVVQAKLTPKYCKSIFDNRKENILLVLILKFFEKYGTAITLEELGTFLDSNTTFSKGDKEAAFFLYHSCNLETGSDSIDFLIDEIKQAYISRNLKSVIAGVEDSKQEPFILLNSLSKSLQELDSFSRSDVDESGISESADKRKEAYIKEEKEGVPSILTGFETFDKMTGGLKNNKLYIIAAPPKSGKSMFLMNVGYNIQERGYNVLYITLENDKDETEMRYDSLDTGLMMNKLAKRCLSKEEKDLYLKKLEAQKTKKGWFQTCYVRDICDVSLLEAKYREYANIRKYDVVIVDYLGLLYPVKTAKEAWLNMSQVSIEVKRLAAKLSLPIVTAVQVNADGIRKAKKGAKSEDLDALDISISKAIIQNTDMMLGMLPLNYEDKDTKHVWDTKVTVMASRCSQSFQFLARMNSDIMKMDEVPYIATEPTAFDGELSEEPESIQDKIFGEGE